MVRAGLGLGLHDALYGSDFRPAFDAFWDYAKQHYNQIEGGNILGSPTMYYDPFIPCHHPIGEAHNFSFGTAHGVMPLYPDDARALYNDAVNKLKWREIDFRGSDGDGSDDSGDPMASFVLLMGQFLAREFGDEALHAKLKIRSDANDEPIWDPNTGELTWRFGLDEPHPRGQMNANAALADVASPGAWANIINKSHQQRFIEPTVYGVDFPKVCLSQAIYDAEHRLLAIATDAGAPHAAGESTAFRITNVEPDRCTIVADGAVSDDWRAVERDIEVLTTVGEHTFVIHMN